MALPSNDHYVHSDGYRSEKGSVDEVRMMEEVADGVETVPCVESVRAEEGIDGAYLEIECDGADCADRLSDVVDAFGCRIRELDDGLFEVRPE